MIQGLKVHAHCIYKQGIASIQFPKWTFFRLSVLFSQYGSCDDTQESIFLLDVFMLARSFFNEHDKGSYLLGTVTWSVLGTQNRQAKKVNSLHVFWNSWS